jgi:ParB/RepB/Spo0J family partition protein
MRGNAARQALALRAAPIRAADLETRGDLLWIAAEYLQPDPDQPRKDFDDATLSELASSIADVGVLTPLRVRPAHTATGLHTITDGERRWRAGQQAGVVELPCLVEAADSSRAFLEAYLANLHRDALSPVDAAVGLQHIRETFALARDEELADKVQKSVGWVRQMNAVLALDPETRQVLRDRSEPIAVAVGLRSQSPQERRATLDAIADLPSRDAKVTFIGRVNDERRAGLHIDEALTVVRSAMPSDTSPSLVPHAAARIGRPARVTAPFEWRDIGDKPIVDVHPSALRSTRLATKRVVSGWQWRDAIRDDVIAFRDSCADTPGSDGEWQDFVAALLPLLAPGD